MFADYYFVKYVNVHFQVKDKFTNLFMAMAVHYSVHPSYRTKILYLNYIWNISKWLLRCPAFVCFCAAVRYTDGRRRILFFIMWIIYFEHFCSCSCCSSCQLVKLLFMVFVTCTSHIRQ